MLLRSAKLICRSASQEPDAGEKHRLLHCPLGCFPMRWVQAAERLSCHSLTLPVGGPRASDVSGPAPCAPKAREPDILKRTIPHRQRGRCTTPTRCSPRSVWCLRTRSWDPGWTHYLAKAKQTERYAVLESAAQGPCHKFRNVPGAKRSNKQKYRGESCSRSQIKCTC